MEHPAELGRCACWSASSRCGSSSGRTTSTSAACPRRRPWRCSPPSRSPGAGILQWPLELSLVCIDHLLGGAGGAQPERTLTEIETELVRDLVDRVLSELRYALTGLVNLTPRLTGLESNPQFVQAAAASDLLAVAGFTVRIGNVEGHASLALPMPAVTPKSVDPVNDQRRRDGRPGADPPGDHQLGPGGRDRGRRPAHPDPDDLGRDHAASPSAMSSASPTPSTGRSTWSPVNPSAAQPHWASKVLVSPVSSSPRESPSHEHLRRTRRPPPRGRHGCRGGPVVPAPLEPAEPAARRPRRPRCCRPVAPPSSRRFTGTSHGTVLVVVDAEMAQTLQSSGIGALSLADAARGVLEAAASSAGPIALGPVTEVDVARRAGRAARAWSSSR